MNKQLQLCHFHEAIKLENKAHSKENYEYISCFFQVRSFQTRHISLQETATGLQTGQTSRKIFSTRCRQDETELKQTVS